MSVLLLGFKAFDNYPCEYEVSGSEVLRLAAVVGHPLTTMKGVTANVTFSHEGLTDENCIDNLTRAGDASGTSQLEL